MYVTKHVENYGSVRGVARALEEKNFEYDFLDQLANVPPDCPWYAHKNLDIEPAIDAIFGPVADELPDLMMEMKESCEDILCARSDGLWYVIYVLYMWQEDYVLWVGGQPEDAPTLNDEAREAGWEVPEPMLRLYSVHNGFGEMDIVNRRGSFEEKLWNATCVVPDYRLEIMEWETEGEEGVEYGPGDVLFFYHDGGGDYEGFLKDKGDLVAYYSHEEDFIEDSLAGEFFETVNEVLAEHFM